MRVIFAGTGEIGLPTLKWLISQNDIELLAVVCQPDKPVGRKQVLTPPATKLLAIEHGIPVRQPEKLRSDTDYFTNAAADFIIVMAYGQILPKSILDAPLKACLNLHASILPKYRGASPIQSAILNGDAESGITVMFMDEGMDTGDIILIHRFPLTPDETGGTLHDRLANASPAALSEALESFKQYPVPRQPQENAAATHCGKLGRDDGHIDWTSSAVQIERRIRAFDPWPGTSSLLSVKDSPLDGKRLKIFPPAEVIPDNAPTPILEPGNLILGEELSLTVQTGNGRLKLNKLQVEGKKCMTVSAFLKGNPLPKSATLR